ncbi:MAG: 3'-5' exoribonuclease YhaM family protein [Lachnospiraceae bacterium]|jgi:3'-5' exoribonuclease
MVYIRDFQENDRITGTYLVRTKATYQSKKGKDYYSLTLADKTGTVDTKIWDTESPAIDDFEANDFVNVSGTVTVYNGKLQFKVERLAKAQPGSYNAADFVPASRYPIKDMYQELLQFGESVHNPYIRKLLDSFFVDDKEFVRTFAKGSAARTVHHSFMGGLLEHTLSVTKICDFLAMRYDFLDRDVLIASAMLHDVGKTREMTPFPQVDYSDEGNLLGHIMIGFEMVREHMRAIDGFPKDLQDEIGHCILSHHGLLEYGSPVLPKTAEALALSKADDLDAKMETIREALNVRSSSDWLDVNRWLGGIRVRRTTEDGTAYYQGEGEEDS